MKNDEFVTIKYLILGIALFFLAASIPVLIFTKDKIRCELGLFLGSVIAIGMMFHMNMVIKKSLYMERHHSAYITWNSVGRLLIVAGILVLAAWTGFANVLTMMVGIMGLKVSALLQPTLMKLFKTKNK